MLKAFKDRRYITVDGKPLFYIFSFTRFRDAVGVEGIRHFIHLWQRLARENGLPGVYFVVSRQSLEIEAQTIVSTLRKTLNVDPKMNFQECLDAGFDAVNSRGEYLAEYYARSIRNYMERWVKRKLFHKFALTMCHQKDINKHLFTPVDASENVFPTIVPNFDRSPPCRYKSAYLDRKHT